MAINYLLFVILMLLLQKKTREKSKMVNVDFFVEIQVESTLSVGKCLFTV